MASPRRLLALDVLRAFAVSMVLLFHLVYLRFSGPENRQLDLIRPLMRAGWIGVPVFFVLSGFLIGNLLMREYELKGDVQLRRFWTRRGFKIYPAFYLAIFVYAIYLALFEHRLDTERLLRELFFLQNYGRGGLIDVSWSLAVEEHFYLIFPLLLLLFWRVRSRGIEGGPARLRHSFWPLVPIAAVLLVVCWALRWLAFARSGGAPFSTLSTHVRIDALFIGAALAWFYNCHGDAFRAFFSRRAPWLLAVAIAVMAIAAIPSATLGRTIYEVHLITLLNLSSVLLLGVFLSVDWVEHQWLRPVAFVGTHSYCIYLYHVPFYRVVAMLKPHLPFAVPVPIAVPCAFAGAMLAGIAITHVVEFPMLRLRDRLFPARVSRYFDKEAAANVGGTQDEAAAPAVPPAAETPAVPPAGA